MVERRVYVDKNLSFNVSLLAPEPGKWNATLTVGNDILSYSTTLNITVLPRPVFFKGKTVVYSGEPATFQFLSENSTPLSGKLVINGSEYHEVYEVNGTATLVFPGSGNYTLLFSKTGYEEKKIEIRAYDRMNLENVSISPTPINGVIYLKEGEFITISGVETLYYSLDGGIMKSSEGNITMPGELMGDHRLQIYAVSGNRMGNGTFYLHIYKDPNVSMLSSISSPAVYVNTPVNITAWSEIPLKSFTIVLNNRVERIYVNQNFTFGKENYTYNITLVAQGSYMNFSIDGRNVMGYASSFHRALRVFKPYDDEKPEIEINGGSNGEYALTSGIMATIPQIRVWGGQTITVSAADNTKVVSISVKAFGRYFNSTGEPVKVPTVFKEGGDYHFIPDGTYTATVNATDMYGNSNLTEFQIIVDNTGEKMPPIVVGSTLLIFNSTVNSYAFRAFDNVGVFYLKIYEGSSVIKSAQGSGSNGTIYLNSSDISDGLHDLVLNVTDVNGNLKSLEFMALKNYTDDLKPTIFVENTTVWSGADIVVQASDNVRVQSISAYVFGKWFNRTGNFSIERLEIPTAYNTTSQTIFTSPGVYSMNITVEDVFGNQNSTSLDIEINNTGERVPPTIFLPESGIYNSTDTINITAFDNVGVKRVWISDALGELVEVDGGNLSCNAGDLGYGERNLIAYAEDVNGNIAAVSFSLGVDDNIPPKLLITEVRMWGGNTTNITLWDNFAVKRGEIRIFNHTFSSIGNRIEIETEFESGDNVSFVPEGTYLGMAKVEDISGNVNTTYIRIIIDNTKETRPPVITGESYQVVSNTTDAVFRAFDNVGVARMWWVLNGTVMGNTTGNELRIGFQSIPLGTQSIVVYAEDVNGNVALMNATIDVLGKPEVDVRAYLLTSSVETTERGMLSVLIENGANPGNYTVRVYLDGELYYNITGDIGAFETKTITINLPYLSKGKHTIEVENQTLVLDVYEPPVEKVPIDLVLKYDKNLKVTASESVIYKGFQISQGNFYLVTGSLVAVGIILGALGMYSSILKSINSKNVAILRAIGASNRHLVLYSLEDIAKYVFPSILGGVFLGYVLLKSLEYTGLLRAFGHRLVVSITPGVVLGSVLISLGFLLIASVIILYGIMHSKVVHLFGGEKSEKIYMLEEVLDER